jgi:integrase
MVRRIRDKKLETRSARLSLTVAKSPVWLPLGRGISIGYRRNRNDGTWIFRKADGKGGMQTKAIGMADDFSEADGNEVLDFWQAQEKVRGEIQPKSVSAPSSMTVRQAADAYFETQMAKNARTTHDAEGRLEKHFLGKFATKLVRDLTKTELESWHASMIKVSHDADVIRRSKDSANRVLSIVKAMLNKAISDSRNGISSDNAWRLVKPFHGVSKARDIRLSPEQARALIAVCDDVNFGNLVSGAYLTGARYGELNSCRVRQYDPVSKTLSVSGKTGRRAIILQSSAVTFLSKITAGRSSTDYIFLKSDGSRWKASEQARPMAKALTLAGLDERGCLYDLRHAYISEAIENNVPVFVIAKNCGTSIRMIETNYAKVLAEKTRAFIEMGAPSMLGSNIS